MKDYLSYGVEDFITDESYLRYYFRENEADIRFWTGWIGLHPEKLDLVISANNYIDAFSVRLPEAEFQKEQQRFGQALQELALTGDEHQDVAAEETIVVPVAAHRIQQRTQKRSLLVAAACIAVAGAMVYVTRLQTSGVSGSDEAAPVAMIEKYAPKGKRVTIVLPDSSTVTLNADSKLSYPATFTGNSRELQLTGEAFFQVKNDAKRPFHVTTSHLTITVLGTSFNMKCYPDNKQVKVALVTGKVRVERISDPVNKKVSGEALVLTPAEMGVFNKVNLSLNKTAFDTDEETGWLEETEVFKNADFNEIASRLDKVYNIQLINRSHKTAFRFTGTFSHSTPEEIVNSICLSKKLSYTTNGNTITIH